MITVHIKDERGLFVRSEEVDPMGPMPPGSVLTAPPALAGAEVACWHADQWLVFTQAPPAFDAGTHRLGMAVAAEGKFQWDLLPLDPAAIAERLQVSRAALIARIDADADAIYGAVLGNRAQEYTLAESEALAYQAAGYAGAAPASVQAWADAKAATAQWAADDILATAAAWRGAQAAIRANRLLRKEQARTSADSEAVAQVAAQWAGFIAAVRAQLGLPA